MCMIELVKFYYSHILFIFYRSRSPWKKWILARIPTWIEMFTSITSHQNSLCQIWFLYHIHTIRYMNIQAWFEEKLNDKLNCRLPSCVLCAAILQSNFSTKEYLNLTIQPWSVWVMMISFYNEKILHYGIFVVTHKPCISKKSWLISERIREHNYILWVKQSVLMTKILWNLVYGNTVLSVSTASIDSGPRRWLAIGSQLVQARMR